MLLFIGFQRLGHFAYVRADPMVCGVLRVARLPAVSTFWRYLMSLTIVQSAALLRLGAALRATVWALCAYRPLRVTVDIDTTVSTVYGAIEGPARGTTPSTGARRACGPCSASSPRPGSTSAAASGGRDDHHAGGGPADPAVPAALAVLRHRRPGPWGPGRFFVVKVKSSARRSMLRLKWVRLPAVPEAAPWSSLMPHRSGPSDRARPCGIHPAVSGLLRAGAARQCPPAVPPGRHVVVSRCRLPGKTTLCRLHALSAAGAGVHRSAAGRTESRSATRPTRAGVAWRRVPPSP